MVFPTSTAPPSWCLVVPVKLLAHAKTRLAGLAGARRAELALAFAADTITAALRCPRVVEVIAVSDDPRARELLTGLGATVVPDEPDAGLNPALAHGAAVASERRPACGVAALSADLPALRPDELARALDAAAGHRRAFVPDAAGVGTTLLAAAPRAPLEPAFGGRSRDRHRHQGAYELVLPGIDSVRRDVDTEADLAAALALGVGARTAAVLAELGGSPRPAEP
ncbi:2-phospho-L-lactate guanylyltransferase [Carbonactinospora thermoautotrophica]|uniref:Phosphoenolpyruvate guanylyltransferase n=2 Tax=Carbonactinospora thermoautotrophica TaxID=1469144 RepID=A0A132MP59_9ACTN|nr:2-phospho-L-lactate guanylyltransferase [Carbonactinospora thermoautotrophica]KWW99632.1 2-phospho-L-lactate guanylyltransferase [Carbonactinospora thermoautotrophica]KWX03993.1 2-phospho-L-lactate guanylyltransferase [Carbonactinospora thermoautotrophica]